MKKALKQFLSISISLAIIFACLPLAFSASATSAAFPGSYIKNGGFESGDVTNWNGGSTYFTASTEQIKTGSYSVKATGGNNKNLDQTISVEKNTDYEIRFYSYIASSSNDNGSVKLVTTDWSTQIGNVKYINGTTGSWQENVLSFNSGDNTKLKVVVSLIKGTVYFDDIYIKKANNLVRFGNFPTGTLNLWGNNTAVSIDEGCAEGDFGYHLSKTGSNDTNTRQTVTVEKNTDYILSFYSRGTTGSISGMIKITDSSWNQIKTCSAKGGGDWAKSTCIVNSGDRTSIMLFIQSNGGAVKFSNVSLVKAAPVTLYAEEGGTASSNDIVDGYAEIGSYFTATATAPAGKMLEGWYNADSEKVSSEANYTFKVTDAINLTAKFTSVVEKLDVKNPGFEDADGAITNAFGWYNIPASFTKEITDTQAHTGDKSLHLAFTGTGYNHGFLKITNIKPNTEYKLRFYAKSPTKAKLSAQLNTSQWDGNTRLFSAFSVGETDSWQEYVKTIPATNTATTLWFDLYSNNTSFDVYIDDITVATAVPVSADVNGNGSATVKNQYGTTSFLCGDNAVFIATPDAGYSFDGWYDGDTLISSNAVYTAENLAEPLSYTAKFVNLPVNKANLLNPDFEDPNGAVNGTYGWEDISFGTKEITTAQHQSGEKSLHFVNDTTGDKYAFYKITGIDANTEYKVRFYAKATINGDGKLYRKVVTGKWDGTTLAGDSEVYNCSVWTQFVATIPSTNTATTVYLGFRGKNCEVYIDDITVAKTVSVEASAEANGTATVKNQFGTSTFLYGDNAVFTATPNAGYSFDGWYDGNTKVSANTVYTEENITNAVSYTAKFNSAPIYKANITNSDFETGTGAVNDSYGWQNIDKSITAEITDSEAHSGEQSLHLAYSGTGSAHAYLQVNVDANREYKLRFYTKSSDGGSYSLQIMHTSKWTDQQNGGVLWVAPQVIATSTEWSVKTVTIPANNVSGKVYLDFVTNKAPFNAYIDDITVAVESEIKVDTDSVKNKGYVRFANQYGEYNTMADATYLYGDTVNAYAYPDYMNKLIGWRLSSENDYLSTDNDYSFELNGDTDIVADFGFDGLGDFDTNEILDATDLSALVSIILGEQIVQDIADINSDNSVNILDLVALKKRIAGVGNALDTCGISGANGYLKQLAYTTDGSNKAGELIELSTHINGITSDINVFDSDELDLSITLTKDDKSVTVPGFYYKGYNIDDNAVLGSNGDSDFRFRFTLPEAGEWSFTVTLKLDNVIVDTLTSRLSVVANADNKGYISASENRFAYDDGTLYTPIGQNIAFSTANSGVRAKDIIGKMTNAEDKGANFVRVWVNPWSISLQKKGYAPNDLTGGMRDAVQFDELLNAADELGMTVQLSLFTHTMFKSSGSSNDAGWNDCVYNSANTNGIISTPQAFFTDATAKKQTKDYLRYMVARYGYSDNLFAWELMNEADSTTNYDASAVAAWYTEMTAYLKSIDAYNHMVTSSATDASATQSAYNSDFDFASLHLYYDDGSFVDDFISTRIAEEANDSKYDGKPVMFGELGYQDNGVLIVDNNNMHRQLWATLMSCGAAGASWCWDTIEESNLYSNYTAIKDFAQYIDFENTSYYNYKKAFINDTNAFGYVGSTSAYLWIYKRNYGDVSSASYTVSGLTNGTYTVKWIDTNTGYLVGSAQTKTVSNGSLTLNSPSFTNDIAVRVIKQ